MNYLFAAIIVAGVATLCYCVGRVRGLDALDRAYKAGYRAGRLESCKEIAAAEEDAFELGKKKGRAP